jgi:membrane-associated phospholipid phosphatase
LRALDIPRLGIIQFPSYHTVQTVMAAWATWHMRWIGPANVLLTGAVLVTTLPIGGHHLMDIVGGALVSALCLAIAVRVEVPAGGKSKAMPASGIAGFRSRLLSKLPA